MNFPNKYIFILNLILLLSSVLMLSGFQYSIESEQDTSIVGTWVSKEDPNSVWIFKEDGTLIVKYEGVPNDYYTYRISSTSPQCGKNVQTGPNITFLELTEENSKQQYCYYINGITDETLSLSMFNKGGVIIFQK